MVTSLFATTTKIIIILEIIQLSACSPTSYDSTVSFEDEQIGNTSLIRTEGRGMSDDHGMMAEPKSKPWLGYYDFLITEGSYKFWVVFELFTVALLIYSAFAALYYAKYTISDYDYDDYFFKRRSGRSVREQQTFLGLSADTYLRIFEAITNVNKKFS